MENTILISKGDTGLVMSEGHNTDITTISIEYLGNKLEISLDRIELSGLIDQLDNRYMELSRRLFTTP